MDPVTVIAASGTAFVATHLLMSHLPVRSRLIGALGRVPFLALYSVVSTACWVPLVWAWWTNPHAGAALWAVRHPAVVHGVELVNLLALGLTTAGAVVASPASITTSFGPERDHLRVQGPAAITRHPVLVGLGTVALTHMVLNGWAGDLWFWGAHAVLAFGGALHQDARHRRTRVEYEVFARETTIVPRLTALGQVGARAWVAFGVGMVLAVGLRALHPWFL